MGMKKLYVILTELVVVFTIFMTFSCSNVTIPLTIKNKYHETIDTVIIGIKYIKDDIRLGESKTIMSPLGTVLVRVYTKSNKVVYKTFHLYPHNAHNVMIITVEGRLILQ